jgi:hypothetical protein
MTTLADGRVLLAGGAGNGGVRLTTAEVYNPDANVWTAGAAMSAARGAASAVLLDDGSVLEVSGFNSDSLDSVERYAPWPVGGCRATYLEAQLQKARGIGHYFFQTPSLGLAARLRAVDVGARQPKSLADGLHWSSRFSKERTRNLPFIRGVLRSFLEDLVLQRLLAKHALKLGDLGTSGCQLRGRHHSLASRYGRQRLLLELAPLEQQADGNAFLARDERHAHARFIDSTNQRLRRWSLKIRQESQVCQKSAWILSSLGWHKKDTNKNTVEFQSMAWMRRRRPPSSRFCRRCGRRAFRDQAVLIFGVHFELPIC